MFYVVCPVSALYGMTEITGDIKNNYFNNDTIVLQCTNKSIQVYGSTNATCIEGVWQWSGGNGPLQCTQGMAVCNAIYSWKFVNFHRRSTLSHAVF